MARDPSPDLSPQPAPRPAVRRRTFDDPESLAGALATSVADDLRRAIDDRGRASLVVSGGGTPRPFFAALRRADLAWDRVVVSLADERWVAPEDAASNQGLVGRHLLRDGAARARFVPLKTPAPTPEAGAEATRAALAAMPRPFDVLILGMGTDGHTASLFPGAAETAAGLDPDGPEVLAVRPPEAETARLSLGLRALLDSRRIVLHITGEAKRRVLERALGDGPAAELPIRAVLRGPRPVDVYWAPTP